MQKEALIILASFLIGSIPFASVISKRKGINIRVVGSRNPGATNVWLHVGRGWGILVALLDGLKGFASVSLAQLSGLNLAMILAAGFASILGHCFMPFSKFNGGKGVATSAGVLITVFPVQAAITGVIWAIVFLIMRKVTWAYISIPFSLFFLLRPDIAALYFVGAMTALITYTHRNDLKERWR